MSEAPRRNRNQVFSRYLPGSVMTIEGETVEVKRHYFAGAGLDASSEEYIRRLLATELERWPYRDPAYRSLKANPSTSDFELVRTEKVQAVPVELYECKKCRAVQDAGRTPDRGLCRRCRGELRVLPFLMMHSCGRMQPLRVMECKQHRREFIKLERFGLQRWVCGICHTSEPVFGTNCGNNCELVLQKAPLSKENGDHRMRRRNVSDPGVHNAQILTLLNPPYQGVASLLKDFEKESRALFLASYLGLAPDFANPAHEALEALRDLKTVKAPSQANEKLRKDLEGMGLSPEQIAKIIASAGQAHANPREERAQQLGAALKLAEGALGPEGCGALELDLHRQVRDYVLAGQLEGVMTLPQVEESLRSAAGAASAYAPRIASARKRCATAGVVDVAYVPELPILSAAYGFTRLQPRPSDTVLLKPFPRTFSVRGAGHQIYPIFIAPATTEALLVTLSSRRMMAWLVANEWVEESEVRALDSEEKRLAWLLRQQQSISFDTLPERVTPVAWAVTTCVHSMSHLIMGQVASQSSFGETSLSEMLFPATLSSAIYVNQRSEFSLGGLRTFLEQRLDVALAAAFEDEGCMLDPGCEDDGGACVGCLYIPEVSCRLMNTALSRHVLFGGPATGELAHLFQRPIHGFLSHSVERTTNGLFV